MPRLARFMAGFVVVGLVLGAAWPAGADEAGRYRPPQTQTQWPARPIAVSPDAPTSWPGTPAAGAPRLLPAGYQAPESGAPSNDGSADTPRALTTDSQAGSIPLSQQSPDAPSSFGGLPTGGMPSLVNAATSLGIVLGLFLLLVWAVRRGTPKGSGLLPREAFEVLGRAPLMGRQQVHLVRCGNKIVLLCVTAGGIETLTEITDPAEADRLHSICQPPSPPGGALRQWLGQFTGQSQASEYYTPDDSREIDFGHLETGHQAARGAVS